MKTIINMVLCMVLSASILFGEKVGWNISEIPNSLLLDNTTRPSVYNSSVAWHDGTYNGNLYYWDGINTTTIASGCFGGDISLFDGKISYMHNAGSNNGTRVYYWDGGATTNISGDLLGGWQESYNGTIAFSGSDGSGHELFYWDRTVWSQTNSVHLI